MIDVFTFVSRSDVDLDAEKKHGGILTPIEPGGELLCPSLAARSNTTMIQR